MFRIGNGYDVHRLVEGRKLILGGVNIPHSLGLDGHSDGDVLCHALCDAILGACGAGDLGKHFPDTDNKWKGISSLVLLEKTGKIVETANISYIANKCIKQEYQRLFLKISPVFPALKN